MTAMNYFKIMIIAIAFYSIAVTGIVYTLPSDAATSITLFEAGMDYDLQSVSEEIEDNIQKQTDVPVVEVGALIFYSGNILIDMLLNFITAVPQMIFILLTGFGLLFTMDPSVLIQLQIFAGVVITLMYVLMIIQMLTSIRSGRVA